MSTLGLLLSLALVLVVLMAAPATTARGTPTGKKLKDGHNTKITFALNATLSIWEKSLTPPGIDNGEAIDQTTQFNSFWTTKAAQALNEITNGSLTCAYDPDAYNQIIAIIGREGSITFKYRDGSTLDFFGYLKSFKPGEVKRGAQPEATCEFVATNWDNVNGVEQGPVLTSVSGT